MGFQKSFYKSVIGKEEIKLGINSRWSRLSAASSLVALPTESGIRWQSLRQAPEPLFPWNLHFKYQCQLYIAKLPTANSIRQLPSVSALRQTPYLKRSKPCFWQWFYDVTLTIARSISNLKYGIILRAITADETFAQASILPFNSRLSWNLIFTRESWGTSKHQHLTKKEVDYVERDWHNNTSLAW